MSIKPITPSLFILSSLVGITLLLPSYFLVINYVLASQDPVIPGSYKELLLTRTTGERIIIDSGSNSYFGIDTYRLSNAFGRTVINMADNAGYPLNHKIHYLLRYARKGDILLLPLEWQQYAEMSIPDNYIEPVIGGKLGYYYTSLPLQERISLAYQNVPVNIFLSSLVKRTSSPHNKKWAQKSLKDYQERLHQNNAYSLGSYLTTHNREEKKPNISCDQYIFRSQLTHGFKIGEEFKKAMTMLQDITKIGVNVIFAWPTVVDYDQKKLCYHDNIIKQSMQTYSLEIKKLIESHGFKLIGTPEESHYPQEYFNDTYYHLNEKGAKIRTEHLVKQLFTANVAPASSDYSINEEFNKLTQLINKMKNFVK